MNEFEIKKAEAKVAAKLLMALRHQHMPNAPRHHADPREQELCPRFFLAVENILRSHVREKPFSASDIDAVEKALNLSVSFRRWNDVGFSIRKGSPKTLRSILKKAEPGSRVTIGGRVIRYLEPDSELESLRSLAEQLVRYLSLFRETPQLMDAKPIGICAWAECRGLFRKGKTDARFCSSKCRELDFRKKRGKEYYRQKARKARDAKRRLRKAKAL